MSDAERPYRWCSCAADYKRGACGVVTGAMCRKYTPRGVYADDPRPPLQEEPPMASDAKPVPGAEVALTAEERARCEEIARDHERYAANYHNNAFGHDASADEERCHFIARALRIAALRASPEPAAPTLRTFARVDEPNLEHRRLQGENNTQHECGCRTHARDEEPAAPSATERVGKATFLTALFASNPASVAAAARVKAAIARGDLSGFETLSAADFRAMKESGPTSNAPTPKEARETSARERPGASSPATARSSCEGTPLHDDYTTPGRRSDAPSPLSP